MKRSIAVIVLFIGFATVMMTLLSPAIFAAEHNYAVAPAPRTNTQVK